MDEGLEMSGRLEDKICVVTGAASGIGEAIVRGFQSESGIVVGIDLERGIAGDRSLTVDVTKEAQVQRAFEEVRAKFGRVDVLVNAAGISPPEDQSIVSTRFDVWNRVITTNLSSVFLCCKYGIPTMIETSDEPIGSVINIASFVAIMGSAVSQCAYTASKGGVVALSRELGVQFAKSGVRVNSISPGPVDTPLLRRLFLERPNEASRRLKHIPIGRFGRVEEVANAALFLASDESSLVNATNLAVDGGISAAYMIPNDTN